MESLFLGKPVNYWVTLKQRVDELDFDSLISEIAVLRSKVSFYESRIDELAKFMALKLEVK